ncbi:recombinase family protein [Aetokthonos hydrillicola Thurmond2011]|jgi:DNA invertase Pin-like site-specific DNA recombinase/predicted metal-binding protein|uniref:Recombinase family protein n=1 Tax=Aetokthonos hydrillicola Thurmond2011 TaxID=2712845 RepID=A0AAP5M4X0_9CYAN|nr:recombinase family protein [Aetokthonos hydrillicola]MBO3459119.1 recombinase family protein [Aetokthonos hydrillicola CCALA 1050]MBW4584707.1 recombinase family protein [Aetokthonos hydrillicola CCALA 1050]MDR9895251.1 recombinase family protein [Aetokthonos hydrillicola Thurmond2011]
MTIFAYTYTDPLLEEIPGSIDWGQEVDRVYQDLGKRSQLHQLFDDCKIESPNCVLIRRLQELGDTVEEVSEAIAQLQAMNITLIAVEQGYNSSQENTTLCADLLKLLSEIQRQQSSNRIRQGHARNRLDAAPPPGKAPYGYRRGKGKYTIDRSTSPVIKDFFEHFLLYNSLRGAVRYLAKKYGKKISVTTGRRWLTNPVYRGDTAYHNDEIISNTHAPIISREEGAQVDRLLRRNSRLPPRSASAPRSLAGLVVCGECQSHMTVTRVTIRKQEKEYLYLRPISCTKQPKCRAIPYQEVLEHTISAVCRDLPLAVADMNFPQLDAVKKSVSEAIAHQQQILEQLPALQEIGVLDPETAKLRAYKLRTEISELRAKLATLPPVNLISVAKSVSISAFWLDLSESERRFYFREFIRQIEIFRKDKDWELQVRFIF